MIGRHFWPQPPYLPCCLVTCDVFSPGIHLTTTNSNDMYIILKCIKDIGLWLRFSQNMGKVWRITV